MTTYGLSSKITIGKHAGLTIEEIIQDDPSYLEWALDEIERFELNDEALAMLDRVLGQDNPIEGLF